MNIIMNQYLICSSIWG